MSALDLLLWAIGGALGAAGVAAVALAAAGKPARVFNRRTNRCACCGYALDGLEDPICPECGRTFAAAIGRRARRRRAALVLVGAMLLTGAAMTTQVKGVVRHGLISAVPSRALAVSLVWMPGAPQNVFDELHRRAMLSPAGSAERRALAAGCVRVLEDRRDLCMRRCAAALLAEVSSEIPGAAAAAVDCLRESDPIVRVSAVRAIARAKMQRARTLRILSSVAVTATSPAVRSAAIHGAAMVGCDRVDVVDTLAGALHDPSPMVRERALYALAAATAKSPRAEQLMTSRLRDGDTAVREAAIWAVSRAAEREAAGDGWVMVVAEALWDSSPTVRATAAACLRDMGRRAEPALARLAALVVQEDDEGVRVAARQAVEAINSTRPG